MHFYRTSLRQSLVAVATFASFAATTIAAQAVPAVAVPHGPAGSAQRVHVGSGIVRSAVATGTFNIVHDFSAAGAEGKYPLGALDIYNPNSSGATLYGEASDGGANLANPNGTLFSEVIATSAYKDIHDFTSADGASPQGGLVSSTSDVVNSKYQFGVTQNGGTFTAGTVFRTDLVGNRTVIHNFTGGSDGATPVGRLVLYKDGDYYGTTSAGGSFGFGTIFKITQRGNFTLLHTFTGGADGATPLGGLGLRFNGTSIANEMYGATAAGGTSQSGVVYSIVPDAAFKTVYTFTNGNDGSLPVGELQSDSKGDLFGVASQGGQGVGTVYELSPSNAFTTLYAFPVNLTDGTTPNGNQPGAGPTVAANNSLYGTTVSGGASNNGVVWKITNGVFQVIHSFAGTDGANPAGRLTDGLDGYLYGNTQFGGSSNNGVSYRIGG